MAVRSLPDVRQHQDTVFPQHIHADFLQCSKDPSATLGMTTPENPSHSRSPATHPCFQTCGGGSAANRKRNDTRMPLFLNSRRSHIILRRPSLNPLTLQNPFVFHHLPANRTYRFGSGASIGRMETSPAMTRSTFSPVSTRRQPSLSMSTALPV